MFLGALRVRVDTLLTTKIPPHSYAVIWARGNEPPNFRDTYMICKSDILVTETYRQLTLCNAHASALRDKFVQGRTVENDIRDRRICHQRALVGFALASLL